MELLKFTLKAATGMAIWIALIYFGSHGFRVPVALGVVIAAGLYLFGSAVIGTLSGLYTGLRDAWRYNHGR